MLEQYAPRLLVTQLSRREGGDEPFCTRLDGIVLFVDIVASTALTDEFAQMGDDGAERLAAILNRYFGRVIEIVANCGGDTVRIDGDAVIALWQAGVDDADRQLQATQAAAAALAAQREFRDWQPEPGVLLRHRITLVAGVIQFIVVSERSGRAFFVADGAPIRELGNAQLRGDPDQVIVSDAAAAWLGAAATMTRAACGARELLAMEGAVPPPTSALPTSAASPPAIGARVRPFVPRVIADRIAAGHAEWIAEFRKLTVVYVNLIGLDTAVPDVAMRIEDAVRRIEAVAHPLGVAISNVMASDKGFVVQIACGLPPFAQEHNALLAVAAARRIRPALAAIGIDAAIGITTGDAFCGDVGSAFRREYMSTGPVMSYAARLMQAATGEILCDEFTARAAAGEAEFSAGEDIVVKGRAEPLRVRRVREQSPSPSSVTAGIGVLFGRHAELQQLASRVAGLARNRGGLAAIDAEPGAGKTHLLAHVAGIAQAHGCAAIAIATSPIERTTAYFAFRAVLQELLRRPDDPPAPALSVMRTRLVELLREHPLATRVALLEDVLPLEFADRGLAPEIKGPARLAGIEDLLVHIAGERAAPTPIVLLLDDLQWLDASSAHVLAALLRRVPRMLAVVATRPVDDASPAHVRTLLAAAYPVVRLPRLTRDSIKAIVSERLGIPGISTPLVDYIQKRSEGLPFFAEQLLFDLRDQGVLTVEDGRCRLAVSDLSAMGAPDSLRDLIVSRVDRLSPGRQLTIKVASVVGRVFETDTVREIHPPIPGGESLDEILDQLIDAGFLSRTSGAPEAGYAFRHGIIQGVTYDLLPFAQRRPLHRRIAQFLESKYVGALAPHMATLAEHWERAAEADRAIAFRIDAADLAVQRYANDDALDHLARVDRMAAEFKIGLPTPSLARCARIRADACQELTRFAEANGHYKVLAALERIPVPGTRAQLMLGLARESTLQALRRASVIRSQSHGAARERDSLAAHIYMRFAEHAYFTNDTLRLAHGTLASLNRAERAAALPEIVNASGGLALGLAAVGMLKWASFYRDRSINLAITVGSPSAQGFAELLACVQSFHIGDWDRMGVHGACGAKIWKTLGDRYRYQCCLVLDGYRLLATGHYERADRALRVFGEQAEEIDSAQVRAWALAARALLDLLLGRSPALALARLATATADGSLHPAERLLCDGIAAAAHLEAKDYPAALRSAEDGLAHVVQGSPAMAGALLFSVPCIAEVLLVLADQATAVGRTRDDLLALSKVACESAQRFAARNRICQPRAALLRGHLAAARGYTRQPRACYREALVVAQSLGLPLEQAMSHLALSTMPGTAHDRDEHRKQAAAILQRLGVVWAPWRHFRYEAATGALDIELEHS